MKTTDDYKAKFSMWAAEARIAPMPRATGIPSFSCRRFCSAEEMNAWKKELMAETARRGGVRWMK
jgi:hypothetical protein